jgi:hypothetical protein
LKCRQAQQLLSAYLDGELAAAQAAALETHLAACSACRQELEALRALSESLGEILRRVEPPADLLDRIMARVREIQAAGARRRASENPAWKKLAVGVGLAAGIGLAALQIGRAGVEMPAPGGPVKPPAVAVDHAAKPASEAGQEVSGERPLSAAEPTRVKAAAPQIGGNTGDGDEAVVTVRPGTQAPRVAEAKPGQPPAAGQVGKSAEAQLASAAQEPGPVKTFLAGTRHVRTTMLKLAVADLEAARSALAKAAIEAKALEVREAWSYQDEQVILRVVLPTAGAERFIEEVSGLGAVTGRGTETADVTSEFNRRLAEYRELAAKSDPQSRALAEAAEKILEALDAESLEAGREVVNVWLALRQS